VEDGTFDLHVGEARWRARAGDVMLSHPGMRFRADFQGTGFNDTCLSLTYTGAGDDGFDPARSWARKGDALLAGNNRVRYLHWGLRKAVEDNLPMLAEYCATEVFRPYETPEKRPYRERTIAWYAERVHAVRERMEREFHEAHSVSDLAASVGMSLFNFTRVFTELAGQPPHAYLRDVRLDRARAMLREGRSVTETCYACGFNNLSHFSRSFARRHGAPPSAIAA
jgi:AraC-like DNA-binding protein